jgi:uncharacterized YigZ family protein
LVGIHEFTEVVKKSKFIAKAKGGVKTIEEAMDFLKQVSEAKASHNCWAYKSSAGYERFSDDGEPGGTAGRPILQALEAEGISDTIVVVVRYFGGTKLGTGGLVRSYGASARLCLQSAETVVVVPSTTICIIVASSALGTVYQILAATCMPAAERINEEYSEDGTKISLTIRVQSSAVEDLRLRITDGTKGAALVTVVDIPP